GLLHQSTREKRTSCAGIIAGTGSEKVGARCRSRQRTGFPATQSTVGNISPSFGRVAAAAVGNPKPGDCAVRSLRSRESFFSPVLRNVWCSIEIRRFGYAEKRRTAARGKPTLTI